MKKIFWALGLTMVFNVAGVVQAQKRAANTAGQRSSQSVNTQANGNASATSNGTMLSAVTNLQAELQNTLDVRKAQVGDQVILKTTQAIRQGGQVIIPKGTSLIGHITEVQQKAKNGVPSKLGMVFDRLQGRDLSTPITATITSITNLHAAANGVSSDLGSDMSGSGTASGGSRSRGSSSGGNGGLLGGGGGGGLLGGVTNTVGGVVNSTTQTVGGVANTATNTLGGATQTVGNTVNGLQISTSASGSAQSSTTLSSPNNNIRLDKGATFNLNVQKTGGN